MYVVIDTNVLVSGLMSPAGPPRKIIDLMLASRVIPCYDGRMMEEYEDVLFRPRFPFSCEEVSELLDRIIMSGLRVFSMKCHVTFIDESDKPFYETALECGALLITGNARHFPAEEWILSPAEFLQRVMEDT